MKHSKRSTRTARKDMNSGSIRNKRMNSDTFKQRQVVMQFVREAKTLLGDKFRRIDVRVGERAHNCIVGGQVLGLARLGDDIIWIPESTLERNTDTIRHVVLHEIVHALTGKGHDESCPLMASFFKPHPKETITAAFMSHFK